MRAYRRLTTVFAFLLAAALFCGAGLTPGWAARCAMMAHGGSCAAMAASTPSAGVCPMSAHAQMTSPMPCCQKRNGVSRSAGAAISAAPCACLHSIPTLPAAWQNASAPQIAPPALDILAPPSFAHAHANILSETQQRRGPPRAGPFVLSSILSTPSLRAPPIA